MPSDDQWQTLAAELHEKTLFVWESHPDPAIAARMDALGIQQVTLDPGGNIGDADWIALQRSNVKALNEIISLQ